MFFPFNMIVFQINMISNIVQAFLNSKLDDNTKIKSRLVLTFNWFEYVS